MLLANYSGSALLLALDMPGFRITSCRVVDEKRTNEEIVFSGSLEKNSVMLLIVEKHK